MSADPVLQGISESPDPFGEPLELDEIRASSGRNLAITTLAKGGSQLLRFLTVLLLARLLAPADFGVLAMVTATIGIADILRDLGLSQATVRLPRITHAQINSVFWINVGLGSLMTVVGILTAPLLATFFADGRVTGVAAAMACNFLVNSLSAQHLALMRRSLRFAELARISLTTTVIGNLVALTMAALGAAYWALVVSALVSNLMTAGNAWRRSGWRPTAPAFDPSVRSMLSFGGYLVGFAFLTYLAQNLQIALIGRFWGAASAGLYTRAYALLMLPLGYVLEPLRMIAPAILSRLERAPGEFRDYYLDAVSIAVLVVAPASAWITLMAPDIVVCVLGPRWTEAGELLRWFALGAVPLILSNTTGWLYTSRGNARGLMNWGAFGWTVVIICMLFGMRWSIAGVAAMFTVGMYLIVVPCLVFAYRGTQIHLADLWKVIWRPIVGALAAAAPVAMLLPELQHWTAVGRLGTTLLVLGAAYLSLLLTVLGQRARIMKLWVQLRSKLGRAP